jgi:hypothetical protein
VKPAKAIARIFVLLGFSYTLLMLPWPGLRPTYARFFRAGNQFVFRSFGRDGVVRFLPTNKAGGVFDCRLFVGNRRTRTSVGTKVGSAVGYTSAAFLTALLVSTPLPFRRRVGAWLWGMLLIHAAVGLTLFLYITYLFGSNPEIATFSLSEFSQEALAELTRLVLFAPFFSLVVPTFIWVLVTFRSEDLAMIVRGQRNSRSTKSQRRPTERGFFRNTRNHAERAAWATGRRPS